MTQSIPQLGYLNTHPTKRLETHSQVPTSQPTLLLCCQEQIQPVQQQLLNLCPQAPVPSDSKPLKASGS